MRDGSPCTHRCEEGLAPLQEQVVRLGSSILPKWGLRPHDPHGEGAPPLHPG